MLLATYANRQASCCLCDWKETIPEDGAELAVREHLSYSHFRVMVSREDKKFRTEYTGPRFRKDLLLGR